MQLRIPIHELIQFSIQFLVLYVKEQKKIRFLYFYRIFYPLKLLIENHSYDFVKKQINSFFIILYFIFKDLNKSRQNWEGIDCEWRANGPFSQKSQFPFPFQFMIFLRVNCNYNSHSNSLVPILGINTLWGQLLISEISDLL